MDKHIDGSVDITHDTWVDRIGQYPFYVFANNYIPRQILSYAVIIWWWHKHTHTHTYTTLPVVIINAKYPDITFKLIVSCWVHNAVPATLQ